MRGGRRTLVLLLVALVVIALSGVTTHAATSLTLRVCLEENSGLYSFKRGKRRGGFDLLVAEAVAAHLNRSLSIQWFESEHDEENDPVSEANALLSAGLCDLIGGYAFFRAALGPSGQPSFTLPDYDGRKRHERGKRIPLGTLIASRPYHFSPFAVVVGGSVQDPTIDTLSDLAPLRIGSEVSTLPSVILARYQSGRLADQIVHFTSLTNILERLEAGEFDATLIELHRIDAYRARHPKSRLRTTAYRHSVGFNMGFAALGTSRLLLEQVNQALDTLHAQAEFDKLAQQIGLTYVPPREPAILERITPVMLLGD